MTRPERMCRMDFDSDLTRSTVEPIVLRLVSERPMYGYEIIKVVNERTEGAFEWKEGTLYPCLHRLEGAGLVRAKWRDSAGGRRRKYYAVTRKGAALLNLDRHARARECLEKVLTLDPGHEMARAKLAVCQTAGGSGDPAPPEEEGAEPCPLCASVMRFWEGNWWCDTCSMYPFLEEGGAGGGLQSVCSQCGGSVRFIEKYGRLWCNNCMRYEPKGGVGMAYAGAIGSPGACYSCSSPLRHIPQYGKNWCDTCRAYR